MLLVERMLFDLLVARNDVAKYLFKEEDQLAIISFWSICGAVLSQEVGRDVS